MIKNKSKITAFFYDLCDLRLFISIISLIIVLKFEYIITRSFFSFKKLYVVFLFIAYTIYSDKDNSWNNKATLFDYDNDSKKEKRTLCYSRFLLLYDFMIMGIVIRKITDLAFDYNFFNRFDLIIVFAVVSILTIGKLIFNNIPEEKAPKTKDQ